MNIQNFAILLNDHFFFSVSDYNPVYGKFIKKLKGLKEAKYEYK